MLTILIGGVIGCMIGIVIPSRIVEDRSIAVLSFGGIGLIIGLVVSACIPEHYVGSDTGFYVPNSNCVVMDKTQKAVDAGNFGKVYFDPRIRVGKIISDKYNAYPWGIDDYKSLRIGIGEGFGEAERVAMSLYLESKRIEAETGPKK